MPKKMNPKQTSKKVASTSSRILRDNRFSSAAKEAAGSALAQTRPSGGSKKK